MESNIFPITPLAQVINYRKEFIEINDEETYKRCRVKLHAQGVVLRDMAIGVDIKTKKQQVCRAGEFLVAEIDAKVGGFGIVPQVLDGAIVSSHYFLFSLNERVLDRKFLDFFIRTPQFREQVSAQGSTNYAAIRPTHVLNYEIPLPPLSKQRRIVARIEELAAKIEEAIEIRKKVIVGTPALMKSISRELIGDIPLADWKPLHKYVAEIENGKSPACEQRPAEIDEWGVVKVGCVSFGSFDEGENKALPLSLKPEPHYEIRAGDFLMSRANTTELVGACAIVKATRPKLLLSDKIFRFIFRDSETINHSYLNHVLKSPALRRQIEKGATGTSPSMKNISKEKVMNLLIPSHSPEEQQRIATCLDKNQAKIEVVKQLQAETAVELDALLPSILDKAFKGEL